MIEKCEEIEKLECQMLRECNEKLLEVTGKKRLEISGDGVHRNKNDRHFRKRGYYEMMASIYMRTIS